MGGILSKKLDEMRSFVQQDSDSEIDEVDSDDEWDEWFMCVFISYMKLHFCILWQAVVFIISFSQI